MEKWKNVKMDKIEKWTKLKNQTKVDKIGKLNEWKM